LSDRIFYSLPALHSENSYLKLDELKEQPKEGWLVLSCTLVAPLMQPKDAKRIEALVKPLAYAKE